MPLPDHLTEEHELPCIEAVLAATLALMTGYSQALQAETRAAQRVEMGAKIVDNLSLLMRHPQLSNGFRQVLGGLHRLWDAMSGCSLGAARDCERVGGLAGLRSASAERLH
jgi:hypothetical protein